MYVYMHGCVFLREFPILRYVHADICSELVFILVVRKLSLLGQIETNLKLNIFDQNQDFSTC